MPDAEMPESEWRVVGPIFLDAYNRTHGTTYTIEDRVNCDDDSADYCFKNSCDPLLKVQWTDADTHRDERIAPKVADSFMVRLKNTLEILGVSGAIISLTFRKLPKDEEEERTLAFWIAWLAKERIQLSPRPTPDSLFRLTKDELEYPILNIFAFVEELEIGQSDTLAIRSKNGLLVAPGSAQAVPDPADRTLRALVRKANKLGRSARDLVLVIRFVADLYETEDLPDIRAKCQEAPSEFREVWVLNTTAVPPPRADRIID